MKLDPEQQYVHLDADGAAQVLAGGAAFWSMPESELDRYGDGWLVSEFTCAEPWPSWEMHPDADEFVYLLSGSATMVFDEPAGPRRVPLEGRGAVVVPRGMWHTAEVHAPSRMLFVTRGRGTQHRPSEGAQR